MDEQVRCHACGAENPPDSAFCERCGERIGTTSAPQTPPPYEPPVPTPTVPTPSGAVAAPAGAGGAVQDAKAIVVGAVLVAVLFLLLTVVFWALTGALPSTNGGMEVLALAALIGTILSGYRAAVDSTRKAALIGGVAAPLPLITVVVLVLGLSTQAEYVGPGFYMMTANYLVMAVLTVPIGVTGGAIGAYTKQRTLGR